MRVITDMELRARQTAPRHPDDAIRVQTVPIFNAGTVVTHDNALKFGAVWGCVKVISETLASLELRHLRRDADGRKHREMDAIDRIVGVEASREVDAPAFVETLVAHALTWGNAYAEIERGMTMGKPKYLHIITPDRVWIDRDQGGTLIYDVENIRGPNTVLYPSRMIHVRGLGFDGVRGYSVISMAARAISVGVAAEGFASSFYANSATPSMIVTLPKNLRKETIDKLRDDIKEKHANLGKKFSVMFLEHEMTATPMTIPQDNAQFIETRKLSVIEICRFFRVPPHKVMDLEKASLRNVEQQNIEFATDTLVPWGRRLESELTRKLFNFEDQVAGHRIKMDFSQLLRGDVKAQAEAMQIMRRNGVVNADEWRESMDMNPIGGDAGSIYIIEGNMATAEEIASRRDLPPVEGVDDGPEPDSIYEEPAPDDDSQADAAFRDLLRMTFERVLRREMHRINDARARSNGSAESFDELVAQFLEEHRTYMERELAAAVQIVGRGWLGMSREVASIAAARVCAAYLPKHLHKSACEARSGSLPLGDQWVYVRADEAMREVDHELRFGEPGETP